MEKSDDERTENFPDDEKYGLDDEEFEEMGEQDDED